MRGKLQEGEAKAQAIADTLAETRNELTEKVRFFGRDPHASDIMFWDMSYLTAQHVHAHLRYGNCAAC